ncbi:MAG: hypothetical protein O3C40_28315 [Planctomycetota bacterium]|nr:hypothetical protein [Planctomycetota bacterium]
MLSILGRGVAPRGRLNRREILRAGGLSLVGLSMSGLLCAAEQSRVHPIDVGARRELFVDQALIERLDGRAELKLHHPTPREIAITFEKPWEGNASGYPTVFQDGVVYRMYYRGHRYIIDPPPLRQAQSEVVC